MGWLGSPKLLVKTDEIKKKGLQEISTDGSKSDHGDELVNITGRRVGRSPGEHPPATGGNHST